MTGRLYLLDDLLVGQSHGAAEIVLLDDVTEPLAIGFPREARLRVAKAVIREAQRLSARIICVFLRLQRNRPWEGGFGDIRG